MVALTTLSAKVALVVLVFDPYALNPFSQPKALFGNASAYVLAGLLAALTLQHARTMLRWSPLHIPVAAFAAAYLLAAAFALDHGVALYGAPDRNLGLISVLDGVLIYFAVVSLVRTRTDLLWLGAALAGTTVLLLGYALVQKLGLDPIPWASSVAEVRPSATAGNPGVLGQYAATVAVAAGTLAVALAGTRLRLILALTAALALAIAWLAAARAAMIGLIAGAVVGAAPYLLRTLSRAQRLVVATLGSLVGILLAAGLALILVLGSPDLLRSSPAAMASALASAGGSVSGRLDIYAAAFAAVRERPLLGVGPDNFVVAYPRYRPTGTGGLHESDAPQSSAHSWAWKILTDAGLLGFAAFLAAVLVASVLAFRRMRPWETAAMASLAAFLGTGLFSIDHVATGWMPWLAFGVVGAPIVDAADEPAAAQVRVPTKVGRGGWSPGRGPRTVPIGLIVLASVLVALFATKDPLLAARHAQDARQAARAGELGNAALLRAAARAVELDPGQPEYWNLLGIGHLRAEDLTRAARAFSEARRLASYQFIYHTNLARAQLSLGLRGDREAKVAALATARQVAAADPHVAEVQYVLTLVEIGNENYQHGVDAGERWLQLVSAVDPVIVEPVAGAYLALDQPKDAERWVGLVVRDDAPNHPSLRVLLARALIAEGRPAEALQQLDFALAADPTNTSALRLKDDLTR